MMARATRPPILAGGLELQRVQVETPNSALPAASKRRSLPPPEGATSIGPIPNLLLMTYGADLYTQLFDTLKSARRALS